MRKKSLDVCSVPVCVKQIEKDPNDIKINFGKHHMCRITQELLYYYYISKNIEYTPFNGA